MVVHAGVGSSRRGHRRRYGAAPRLAVLADRPAAARAVGFLSEIRPGQSPRHGHWSCGRREVLRDCGDGSRPVRHRRFSGCKAPFVQIGPAKTVPGCWGILLSLLFCMGVLALVDWGDGRLGRESGQVLGSMLVDAQIVGELSRVHCLGTIERALLSVHAAGIPLGRPGRPRGLLLCLVGVAGSRAVVLRRP